MKKILLVTLMITSLSFTGISQSNNQQLLKLKDKNPKAFLSIVHYGVKSCKNYDKKCMEECEKICLYAYYEINRIYSKDYCNELALAVSIRINSYQIDMDKVGKITLINYVGAYGDYEEKYKNLNRKELYRLFPEFLVKD